MEKNKGKGIYEIICELHDPKNNYEFKPLSIKDLDALKEHCAKLNQHLLDKRL